ncbi:MAG: gliding motility lipoprotein GldH [Saprospiraceae bacterium]|nr:gliding motility lipoprotein GldH [Saprospiraceae bacterium]
MTKIAFAFVLAILALTACGPNYVIKESRDIAETGWAYKDTLDFAFEIADTTQLYDLEIVVEHTTNFPYQNMYTLISTRFPSGRRLQKQLSLELADKAGVWAGDCGSKDCTITIPIQQGAYFNEAGPYLITLEQFMRVNPLSGVKCISLQISPLSNR